MKKGIIVLLVAVLAAGFAFASFTGSATIGYKYDLDTKNHGIFNSKNPVFKFTFDLDKAAGESVGEGSVYAEIAGEASAVIKDGAIKVTSKVTKANIVAGDIVVGILGPKGAFDYAASYITDDDGNPVLDLANAYEVETNGFTVSFKGFTAAVSYAHVEKAAVAAGKPTYGWVEDTTDPSKTPTWGVVKKASDAVPASKGDNLYLGVQTPAFELAEGLTVQAAGNYKMTAVNGKADNVLGGAAAVAYANEDAKLDAALAIDAEYDNGALAAEVSASASYDFISAVLYFGTNNTFKKGSNILCVAVEAEKEIDAITVGASVEARNILAAKKPWLIASVNAAYAAEQFAVSAGVTASLQDVAGEYKLVGVKDFVPGLGVTAGISSTALINNCTVALNWTGSDFAAEAKGAITASATVKF